MTLPSTLIKGHATGNDFVIYHDPDGLFDPTAEEVAAICDRHRGIGGDGLIRLTRPDHVRDLTDQQRADCQAAGADWFMDYRNADGSLAQMCGNGTRLTSLFAQSLGLMGTQPGDCFLLGTRAGVKTVVFEGDDPQLGQNVFTTQLGQWQVGQIGAYEVETPNPPAEVHLTRLGDFAAAAGNAGKATYANLGNPHIVTVFSQGPALDVKHLPWSYTNDSLDDLNLTVPPTVRPALDEGQNVEFVRIDSIDEAGPASQGKLGRQYKGQWLGQGDGLGHASMRVNERGVGETLSCGTGLCASGIVLRELTGVGSWVITVPGGTLRVVVTDDDVALTGPASLVGRVERLSGLLI